MENLFRQEVFQAKDRRLEGVISLVQPALIKPLALLIVMIVAVCLLFLSANSYSRTERASGILVPNLGLMKLAAPQGGIITDLLVAEGEHVEAGQPLLRITSEKHGLGGFELNQSLADQYRFQIRNLEREISVQNTRSGIELGDLQSRFKTLNEKLVQAERQQQIFRERIEIKSSLVDQLKELAKAGHVADFELKSHQDTLLALQHQSAALDSEKISLSEQIASTKSAMELLPIKQESVLLRLSKDLEDAQVQLAKIGQQHIAELRAPVGGTVTGLLTKAHKPASEGQTLLSILPEGSILQAVLYVPTSAIGFVEPEQKIRIRYDAFPFEKFGIYEGRVQEISENVILPTETEIPGTITDPSYRVVVELTSESIEAYGKTFPLRASMTLDADIILEERTLLRWLFDPLYSMRGKL